MSHKKDRDRAFRQRRLYAAISAIGVVNGEGAASVVYTNDDGLGKALIYPYYTMRDPNHGGLVSAHESVRRQLLEEQDQVRRVMYQPPHRALKVHYLERPTPNANEVRDFNLFLSPRDVWTGTVESAQGLDSVIRHVSPEALARAALDSLAALADWPRAVVTGVGTDWVIHLHPGLLAGEARIRDGYVELVDMGSSRHLGQYPRDLRQVAIFSLLAREHRDREELHEAIFRGVAIVDPSEGPQDGYFHPESILGQPRGPRRIKQHLVRGSRNRNRMAQR